MANHKSAEKAERKIKKRTLINKSTLSRIKTFIKKVEKAVLGGDTQLAAEAFKHAQSEIMKGVTKGVLKLNTASRRVSRLSGLVKKIVS